MTSQCGSDSPDGGAVMSEIETAIFTIITSAGEARASLYQACLLYTSPSPRDTR